MAEGRLDVLIFGATGFTGKYTVKEAARLCKEKPFSWGVAGRNKEALESVVKNFAPESDNIPIVIADIKDEESLKNMAERCKVLVNCCGPYRFYGEPVVKACIKAGTHHVDVSGEPQYMERMQLEYNKSAQDAGVYVVSACGFDSIPCDMGVIYSQQKFNGEINSIETYLKIWQTVNVGGPALHYGTWESAVYGLAHYNELRALRTKLFPERLPKLQPKLEPRSVIHRSGISDGWSVPFPGSDRSVALRTQRFLFEKNKQRPAQIQSYITFKTFFSVIAVAFVGAIFSIMTKCQCGRNLLLKYPKFFSAGMASHEGPKPEAMENSHFSITFISSGWTEKLAEPTDQHVDPPNKEMITKVSGVNPGYGATCTAVLLAALTILKESDKLPDQGGVLTPGGAFAKTTLIEQLNENGLRFEVISSIEK